MEPLNCCKQPSVPSGILAAKTATFWAISCCFRSRFKCIVCPMGQLPGAPVAQRICHNLAVPLLSLEFHDHNIAISTHAPTDLQWLTQFSASQACTERACTLQEGHQPGMPATAAAAAATSTQRQAMQVRRPEQLRPPSLGIPASQNEAVFAASGQPGGSHVAATPAQADRQTPELPDNPLSQHAGHLQVMSS